LKKDAYYFPHFSNARTDRRLKRVRKQLGIEGYGIYFMILETLREQTDFKYPIEDIDLLADEFGTSDEKARAVILNFGLFEVEDSNDFFSPKMIDYLNPYLENKERKRIGGIKGNLLKYKKITREKLDSMTDEEVIEYDKTSKTVKFSHTDSESDSHTDRSSSQSKVKESKVKEKKVNKSKELLLARELAFYEELKNKLDEYPADMIRAFYDYWREPNKSKTKMKWEVEKTWDLNLRLARWSNTSFNSQKSTTQPTLNNSPSFDHGKQTKAEEEALKRIGIK
jgi:hypothetical protein